MDSYFIFTSFASTSAASKPEEVIIVDQEGGSTGGQGYFLTRIHNSLTHSQNQNSTPLYQWTPTSPSLPSPPPPLPLSPRRSSSSTRKAAAPAARATASLLEALEDMYLSIPPS
ncbi:hypothetical protein M407DRAFT_26738 [Tulasnella calospora MUT 4182]|uniref:Uncharacterized protein n=1 Tax=Tulasnella calospora MUT 4182 TaxID=1051891 RepID=A0A0C3Q4E9_9AGAM|nr:hypothetical protein M407DRAFT_26738 [Tulasnella calospora MUT 4182]